MQARSRNSVKLACVPSCLEASQLLCIGPWWVAPAGPTAGGDASQRRPTPSGQSPRLARSPLGGCVGLHPHGSFAALCLLRPLGLSQAHPKREVPTCVHTPAVSPGDPRARAAPLATARGRQLTSVARLEWRLAFLGAESRAGTPLVTTGVHKLPRAGTRRTGDDGLAHDAGPFTQTTLMTPAPLPKYAFRTHSMENKSRRGLRGHGGPQLSTRKMRGASTTRSATRQPWPRQTTRTPSRTSMERLKRARAAPHHGERLLPNDPRAARRSPEPVKRAVSTACVRRLPHQKPTDFR